MPTWRKLYGAIWLNFATIMVGLVHVVPFRTQVHAVLGLSLVLLSVSNRAALKKLECPARLPRIAGASVVMSILALITGALMMAGLPDAVAPWLRGVHLTVTMAGLAQSASVATGHDLWATRELPEPRA